VGAGLWEEIVFRLLLLGGIAFVLARTTSLGPPGTLSIAIVASALAFAAYHHMGNLGEPFEVSRFAFRAVAGTILGILFAFRGLAVVVYMHVFYDLLCDVQALAA
jgi:membrane protease YdiL (CAAX protease family)